MKHLIEFALSRSPSFYARLLKQKHNSSPEKILFLKLLCNNDVVFDIGANRGRYTVLFSNIVGREGQVYAFEPVPTTFKLLSENVARLRCFNNVHLSHVAIGNENGTILLYMPNNDSEQASLTQHDAGSWSGVPLVTAFECEITTLDSFQVLEGLSRLSFLKLDVEGAELMALQGAKTIISRFKPLIHMEVNPQWTDGFGYEPADLFSLLISLGYTDFFIADKKLHRLSNPISEYAKGLYSGSHNILCANASVHRARLVPLIQ